MGMKAEDNHGYSDIIDLPHPVSGSHPQMPLADRAAQFAPFAALTGHSEAIHETARLTEERVELNEESKELLDRKLQFIQEYPDPHPEITVTYFLPDGKKSGGAYVSAAGRIKKLDTYGHTLIMQDGLSIPLDDVIEIESEALLRHFA